MKLAIKCDFRYSEDDKNYPEHVIDSLVGKSAPVAINIKIKNAAEFHCDDDGDKGTSFKDFIQSRFEDSDQPNIEALESSDFDEESLCATTTKEIRPKALPSVANNNLLTIINHRELSQTVTIEICT